MTGEEGMREKDRVRQLEQQLRDELRQELDGYRQVEDEELYDRIDRKIFEAGSQGYLPLKERLELRKSIFNSFRKLDILQQLLDDPEITEVMIKITSQGMLPGFMPRHKPKTSTPAPPA